MEAIICEKPKINLEWPVFLNLSDCDRLTLDKNGSSHLEGERTKRHALFDSYNGSKLEAVFVWTNYPEGSVILLYESFESRNRYGHEDHWAKGLKKFYTLDGREIDLERGKKKYFSGRPQNKLLKIEFWKY